MFLSYSHAYSSGNSYTEINPVVSTIIISLIVLYLYYIYRKVKKDYEQVVNNVNQFFKDNIDKRLEMSLSMCIDTFRSRFKNLDEVEKLLNSIKRRCDNNEYNYSFKFKKKIKKELIVIKPYKK